MGDTFPNLNNNSEKRNPTFYYIGTLGPLGVTVRGGWATRFLELRVVARLSGFELRWFPYINIGFRV